ncbi:hypothetical protein [Streptomyces sp. NPDC055287]
MGAAVTGCTEGTGAEELSAERMLANANDTMNALDSVTIDGDTTATTGGGHTSRLTTDLKSRCVSRTSWAAGGSLEQIRIGDTDYVRPDRAYLKKWSGRDLAGDAKGRSRWIKTPSSEAKPGEGLAECTRPFAPFGVATKGDSAEVDGRAAMSLVVTDETDKGSTYTFYVATDGKPYVLKVVYEGAEYRSTTSFSAFDKPLHVRPPAKADIVDASTTGR